MPPKRKIKNQPASLNELIQQQLVLSKKILNAAKKHLAEVKRHSKLIDHYIKTFKAQQAAVEAKNPRHQYFINESSAVWIGKTIWNWKLKQFVSYRTSCDSRIDTGNSPANIDMNYADDLDLIKTRVN